MLTSAQIVHSEFPLPSQPTHVSSVPSTLESSQLGASPASEQISSQPTQPTFSEDASDMDPMSQVTTGTNKENATPMMPPPPRTSSRNALSSNAAPARPNSDPLESYPDLAASYQSSIHILKTSFGTNPPYTIQRLAELVLDPKRHYRFLPPYLNALDRIVSVSSPTTAFPLPQQVVTNGILQTNGDEEKFNSTSGDEGLGGALLTPIPWLRSQHAHVDTPHPSAGVTHETVEEANGVNNVETHAVTSNGIPTSPNTVNGHQEMNGQMTTEQELREQGAVTQGELLRQEQEAGVVPVTQITARRPLGGMRSSAVGPELDVEELENEEAPHARGPDEIGMEDLGPQEGALGAGHPLNLEAALGRSPEPEPRSQAQMDTVAEAEAKPEGQTEPAKEDEKAASDQAESAGGEAVKTADTDEMMKER